MRPVRRRDQGHRLRTDRSAGQEASRSFRARHQAREACLAACVRHGVATAAVPERIAPKSIFSDEVIIDFVVSKYCDALPLYRQRAMLLRDLGIDVALTTINDAVLRVGELLIPC